MQKNIKIVPFSEKNVYVIENEKALDLYYFTPFRRVMFYPFKG